MKKEDMLTLRHFNIADIDYKGRKIWERPGVLKNTDYKTMAALDKICDTIGCGAVLHCAYDPSGHSEASMHYKTNGTAVDFHLVTPMPFYQQVLSVESALEKMGIAKTCGLGIYPDWNRKGFHFDLRGKWARWGARYVGGEQKYFLYQEVLEYCKRAK